MVGETSDSPRTLSSDFHMTVVVHVHTVNKTDRQTDRSLPEGADMWGGQQGQKEDWPDEMGAGNPGRLGRLPGGKLG